MVDASNIQGANIMDEKRVYTKKNLRFRKPDIGYRVMTPEEAAEAEKRGDKGRIIARNLADQAEFAKNIFGLVRDVEIARGIRKE